MQRVRESLCYSVKSSPTPLPPLYFTKPPFSVFRLSLCFPWYVNKMLCTGYGRKSGFRLQLKPNKTVVETRTGKSYSDGLYILLVSRDEFMSLHFLDGVSIPNPVVKIYTRLKVSVYLKFCEIICAFTSKYVSSPKNQKGNCAIIDIREGWIYLLRKKATYLGSFFIT